MHWALNPVSTIYETANKRATAVRAAIFDCEYSTVDIEKGDFDPVQLDKLPAPWWHVGDRAGFEPMARHSEELLRVTYYVLRNPYIGNCSRHFFTQHNPRITVHIPTTALHRVDHGSDKLCTSAMYLARRKYVRGWFLRQENHPSRFHSCS